MASHEFELAYSELDRASKRPGYRVCSHERDDQIKQEQDELQHQVRSIRGYEVHCWKDAVYALPYANVEAGRVCGLVYVLLTHDNTQQGHRRGEHQVIMPVMQHQMAEHQCCQQRPGQQTAGSGIALFVRQRERNQADQNKTPQ